MDTQVDISKISWEMCPKLVEDLWKNASGANLGSHIQFMYTVAKMMPMAMEDKKSIQEAFETGDTVGLDYVGSKAIKITFRKDNKTIDCGLYDRDHGEGLCQKVVNDFIVKHNL